jgi:SAM-dependent methyltransferase
VLTALALKPDAVVADLGAGTGYFSMRLAHFVSRGRVYAVDLEPGMVTHLADRAKGMGLSNVTAVQGAPDDARLPAKVDLVLLVDVYHHIDAREKYFARLRNSLAPGGRVAVVDFNDTSPVGPPRSERLSPKRVKEEMREAGYAFVEAHDFLPNQYFLVFSIPKR